MVKVPVPIEEVMGNPNLSITTSPFAPGKMIIKRASFRGGEVPSHLEPHLISSGSRAEGTVVYKGKPIPKAAAETFGLDTGD